MSRWGRVFFLVGLTLPFLCFAAGSVRTAVPPPPQTRVQTQSPSTQAPILETPAAEFSRTDHPFSLGVTFGNPSPSWVGFFVGLHLSRWLQLVGSGGYFHWGDFTIRSLSFQGRLFFLPTRLSPFFGGGSTLYFVSGEGKFQGLATTSFFLPYFSAGMEWYLSHSLSLAAGVNFHFPVKLNFPFAELRLSF